MALIKCKECHGEISSDAKVCPKCGAKLRSSHWLRNSFIVLAVAIALFVGGGALIGRLSSNAAIAAIERKADAVGEVSIMRYRNGPGDEYYTCGVVRKGAKPDGSPKYLVWYVVQRGLFMRLADSGVDGDPDFDNMYLLTCGK